jgi:hypothetical protein
MKRFKKMSSHAAASPGVIVPAFYDNDTEETLIQKIIWAQDQLGFSDQFFSNLLGVREEIFREWKVRDQSLTKYQLRCLREFWVAISHMLSFLNFRQELVQQMLEFESHSRVGSISSPFTPPWVGTSLKSYLEGNGITGIEEVVSWVQGLRYASSF